MCFSSGKSNTTRKAEKDRYIYNHSQTVIFQDRLVDGIMSVFILHAVAIAKKHYRQRSFLDTVLYLLKSTFFLVKLFANSYWICQEDTFGVLMLFLLPVFCARMCGKDFSSFYCILYGNSSCLSREDSPSEKRKLGRMGFAFQNRFINISRIQNCI